MTTVQRIAFWQRVHEYVAACGGDSSAATVSARRERAVAALEQEIYPWLAPACEHDQARREAEEAYRLLERVAEVLGVRRVGREENALWMDVLRCLDDHGERLRKGGR